MLYQANGSTVKASTAWSYALRTIAASGRSKRYAGRRGSRPATERRIGAHTPPEGKKQRLRWQPPSPLRLEARELKTGISAGLPPALKTRSAWGSAADCESNPALFRLRLIGLAHHHGSSSDPLLCSPMLSRGERSFDLATARISAVRMPSLAAHSRRSRARGDRRVGSAGPSEQTFEVVLRGTWIRQERATAHGRSICGTHRWVARTVRSAASAPAWTGWYPHR
jgi:hypothetical protein